MEMLLADIDLPELASTAPEVFADANRFLSLNTSYLKLEDRQFLAAAFCFADASHRGQVRRSGEPYISHPLAVATILTQWKLDAQALAGALLHDVMEDSGVTKLELTEKFGKTVAELVDGMSKIDKLEFQSKEEAQAENFRKMLLAMARDLRVMLIKLADRLHNMRTMDAMRPDKQKRIARETMEIYAPIANRIGLNSAYQELDDLAFKYLHPNRYGVLSKALKAARGNRREVVGKILDSIKDKLAAAKIEASVTGREKNLYSIYRKMQEKQLSFSEVLDIYAFRVIVKDVPTSYLTLGALHALFKPIPGKFKDYIAIPKANGYQSLHTTLFGPYGTPIEIQIRSGDMHRIADAGVASHWMYKSGDEGFSDVQKKTHQWLQSLLEMQTESGDAVEFLEHIKVDLFPDQVYVFTPKGKIFNMPAGSCCVDFAYAVHSDIGDSCIAAKINHELVPLRTRLKNGDQVEIVSAVHARPNPSWLTFVTTGKARSHIRHFLKSLRFEESVLLGDRLLAQGFASLNQPLQQVSDDVWERYLKENGEKSREVVKAELGLGKRLAMVVAKRLLQLAGNWQEELAGGRKVAAVAVRGSEGMAIQCARCCNPIPGDPILGFVKKDQGLVIHTHDCPQIAHGRIDSEKLIDVEWDADVNRLFDVPVRILAQNDRGTLAAIATAIAEADANITAVATQEPEGFSERYMQIQFTLQVSNRTHLAKVMKNLRQLPSAYRIQRMRS
ncbi:bifunctional (p)ppGpp synthetase/guanosine-3',5'-bis(diphosphate) 3'-pyrophosphohydrolase [Iodobacter sp. LRB]|uniref:Bifunctional (P)ppGpp synthetase/guanosine-3',5'-bis(Diphosphate) 3'-pyrophosphohydrolase n=2 Tax=Iodobacter TaxID=32014 RepID=A0ABX0KKZ5_9NEIS|nr:MULTISPECIES: bifunctional (p)ppGpp synthetase/guanosine-3',5'-bis(diphosphate) 3'-pyrophosphohydrolase [Iodobacter]NHQ84770.1 bifunctional (p)ppGpp synthetase/guanosine-3',5'-bis(diphosphate) 3'-pyrophosphohydrolase [Iodobacter violacea]PHV01849.1 guanosine-3',5'-bis(diphosphate) 3'-pyrophosphohydrolase [Iodobacter sp. BJB302]